MIYDYRFYLCGIRMLTPEGHTVGQQLTINTKQCLGETASRTTENETGNSAERNVPAHLAALDGRGMMRPADADYWPAAESLDWHMAHVFRRR